MVASTLDQKMIHDTVRRLALQGCLREREIVVFGCTIYARDIKEALSLHNLDIHAFVDNNENKAGGLCLGAPVYIPKEYLSGGRNSVALIVCSEYRQEMTRQLESYGYRRDEQIFEIPIAGRQADERDSLVSFWVSSWRLYRGYRAYLRLRKKYGGDSYIFLVPYPGTGDVYMACALLAAFCSKAEIRNPVLCVTKAGCREVAGLFGACPAEVVSAEQMEELLLLYQMRAGAGVRMKPLLFWGWRTKNCVCVERYPQLTFTDMFRYDVFELPEEAHPCAPCLQREGVEPFFAQNGLVKGRTVILAPYAGSFVSGLPSEFWSLLSGRLSAAGYCVCTNSSGPAEPPVEGTRPVFFPYNIARGVLEEAGGLIALRSGLCDVASSAQCKMVVLYESGLNAAGYDFFSLKRMGLNDKAVELIFDGRNTIFLIEKICGYFI